MTLLELNKKFRNEQKCLSYLEFIKWGKVVKCPNCESEKVKRLKTRVKWHFCKNCKRQFSVFSDTIFENTRYPLKKWFHLILMMLNAKQGISSMNLMRNVGGSYKTLWYAAMRVRCAMIDNCSVLHNVVEMDEAFLMGKPRKKILPDNRAHLSRVMNKRGRGTKKTPIVGIVERNGRIALKVVDRLNTRNLMAMLKENVKLDSAVVITDANPSYHKFNEVVEHLSINHKKEGFVKGFRHTNTVDGFFAIIKNSLRGQYRVLSKRYLPFYLVQASYIYNRRNANHDIFEEFIRRALGDTKCLMYYKPVRPVRKIVYKKCKPKKTA